MLKSNVKQLREKANLSKYQLAKECGFVSGSSRIKPTYIDNAENGKAIAVDTALKIFNVLKTALKDQDLAFQDVFYLDEVQEDAPDSNLGSPRRELTLNGTINTGSFRK